MMISIEMRVRPYGVLRKKGPTDALMGVPSESAQWCDALRAVLSAPATVARDQTAPPGDLVGYRVVSMVGMSKSSPDLPVLHVDFSRPSVRAGQTQRGATGRQRALPVEFLRSE
jgi:hypothetical protein